MPQKDYDYFNQGLLKGINPVSPTQTDLNAIENTPSAEPGQGTLTVQVSLARGAVPLEGALVTITQTDGEFPTTIRLVTDQSGKTDKVALSAPNASLSQSPNNTEKTFSNYDIQVAYPGFYTEKALNVPIFDKVDSIQPISLRALSAGQKPSSEIYSDEAMPPGL